MYLNQKMVDSIRALPVCLPETDLTRGKSLLIGTYVLERDQRLQMRALTLHVVQAQQPGRVPLLINSIGNVTVGLYQGTMITGALGLVKANGLGVYTFNIFHPVEVHSPGTYTIMVSNNTSNMDYVVSVTGSLRIYL